MNRKRDTVPMGIAAVRKLAEDLGYTVVQYPNRDEVYDKKGRLIIVARKPDTPHENQS